MEVKIPCLYQPEFPCRYVTSDRLDTTRACSECEMYSPKGFPNPKAWFLFGNRRKVKIYKQLVSCLAQYTMLLQEENKSMLGLAHSHGWRSTEEAIATGIRLRAEITRLTKEIYKQ